MATRTHWSVRSVRSGDIVLSDVNNSTGQNTNVFARNYRRFLTIGCVTELFMMFHSAPPGVFFWNSESLRQQRSRVCGDEAVDKSLMAVYEVVLADINMCVFRRCISGAPDGNEVVLYYETGTGWLGSSPGMVYLMKDIVIMAVCQKVLGINVISSTTGAAQDSMLTLKCELCCVEYW